MKFETVVKRTSALVAGVVVFLIAAGMYLSFKGFVMDPEGKITLVKNAYAADGASTPTASPAVKKIDKNVQLPDGKFLGSAKAPVAIYVYSSFGCFHCANFHLQTLPLLERDYIDNGQVKVVFVDFPLDAKSMQAALISHCFNGSKYIRVMDTLFGKQREWGLSDKTTDLMKRYAYLNGMSAEQAQKCLDDKEQAQAIMEKRQYAINHLGISGTPSFVVSGSQGRQILYGAPDYETLKKIIVKNLPIK